MEAADAVVPFATDGSPPARRNPSVKSDVVDKPIPTPAQKQLHPTGLPTLHSLDRNKPTTPVPSNYEITSPPVPAIEDKYFLSRFFLQPLCLRSLGQAELEGSQKACNLRARIYYH